jgi:hypothetical protein
MSTDRALHVALPAAGYDPRSAERAVLAAGLPELLRSLAPSPFGLTATSAHVLEALVSAVDLGLLACAGLRGAVVQEAQSDPAALHLPALTPAQHRLTAAFQIAVTADDALRRIAQHCPPPAIKGALELDGLDGLLDESDPSALARRVLALACNYVRRMPRPARPDLAGDTYAGTTLCAALALLANAVRILAQTGELGALVRALSARTVTVAGHRYDGLSAQPVTIESSSLLPFRPDDIVGNADYVAAGLRLARDVAGYDFQRRKNPKRVNPILFGLGSPGCGKTVTAHAIGNYFLDYCRERGVPARFLVVRRSDWASSYQNASAANLIRIFREEVYAFEGVAGVYWPDIDTALASRDSRDLRAEEKQNLAAVFGVFDGTLLPRDGKWFLICDANTMHMDAAAVSRIAQNPLLVHGPVTPEDYTRMMRALGLRDVRELLPQDDDAWRRIGEAAARHSLSGRTVDAVCGNIRAHIQDFEYPDAYFSASPEERERIVRASSRAVDEAFILGAIEDMVAFHNEASERDERARFESEVAQVVRQLNASRTALERAAGGGEPV